MDLLKELESDIEEEKWKSFFSRYIPFVVIGACLILLMAGGYGVWASWSFKKIEKEAQLYQQGMACLPHSPSKAQAVFQVLEKNSNQSGYHVLACLQRAFFKPPFNNNQALHNTLQKKLPGALDLILLKTALSGANMDKGSHEGIEKTYGTPGNPWKGLALMVCFLEALHQKDAAKSTHYLQKILSQSDVHPGLQSLASYYAIALEKSVENY